MCLDRTVHLWNGLNYKYALSENNMEIARVIGMIGLLHGLRTAVPLNPEQGSESGSSQVSARYPNIMEQASRFVHLMGARKSEMDEGFQRALERGGITPEIRDIYQNDLGGEWIAMTNKLVDFGRAANHGRCSLEERKNAAIELVDKWMSVNRLLILLNMKHAFSEQVLEYLDGSDRSSHTELIWDVLRSSTGQGDNNLFAIFN